MNKMPAFYVKKSDNGNYEIWGSAHIYGYNWGKACWNKARCIKQSVTSYVDAQKIIAELTNTYSTKIYYDNKGKLVIKGGTHNLK